MDEYRDEKEFSKTDAETAITIIEETLYPLFKIQKSNEKNFAEEYLNKIIQGLKIALNYTSTDKQKKDILNQLHEHEAKLFCLKSKKK